MLTGGSLTKILDFRKVPKTEGFRYLLQGCQQTIGNIQSEKPVTRAIGEIRDRALPSGFPENLFKVAGGSA